MLRVSCDNDRSPRLGAFPDDLVNFPDEGASTIDDFTVSRFELIQNIRRDTVRPDEYRTFRIDLFDRMNQRHPFSNKFTNDGLVVRDLAEHIKRKVGAIRFDDLECFSNGQIDAEAKARGLSKRNFHCGLSGLREHRISSGRYESNIASVSSGELYVVSITIASGVLMRGAKALVES